MSILARINTTGRWRRSSYSLGAGSTCVEISVTADQVSVRDSKDPSGPVLTFTKKEWRAFLRGVRANEFDV